MAQMAADEEMPERRFAADLRRPHRIGSDIVSLGESPFLVILERSEGSDSGNVSINRSFAPLQDDKRPHPIGI